MSLFPFIFFCSLIDRFFFLFTNQLCLLYALGRILTGFVVIAIVVTLFLIDIARKPDKRNNKKLSNALRASKRVVLPDLVLPHSSPSKSAPGEKRGVPPLETSTAMVVLADKTCTVHNQDALSSSKGTAGPPTSHLKRVRGRKNLLPLFYDHFDDVSRTEAALPHVMRSVPFVEKLAHEMKKYHKYVLYTHGVFYFDFYI